MMRSVLVAAAAALTLATYSAVATETIPVEWSQLPDPSAQEFEDPYRNLAAEQMSSLVSLVRLREELGANKPVGDTRARLETKVAQLEAALRAAGMDVDWLVSQRWVVADRRRQAAVAVNGALDGRSVEIAGFLISASSTDSGRATAYLLPDRGVCTHLPAPPPNQLVRLVIGNSPAIEGFCIPAVVRGKLHAQETRGQVFVIEETAVMSSAWTLELDDVRAMNPAASGNIPQR